MGHRLEHRRLEFEVTKDRRTASIQAFLNHTRSVTGLKGFQVLLRVDESTYEPVRKLFIDRGNAKPMGKDHPIAWTNTLNDGCFFYTELGHDVTSLDTVFGRNHILGAIQWAARKESKL